MATTGGEKLIQFNTPDLVTALTMFSSPPPAVVQVPSPLCLFGLICTSYMPQKGSLAIGVGLNTLRIPTDTLPAKFCLHSEKGTVFDSLHMV